VAAFCSELKRGLFPPTGFAVTGSQVYITRSDQAAEAGSHRLPHFLHAVVYLP
jgi:hypothetical protein